MQDNIMFDKIYKTISSNPSKYSTVIPALPPKLLLEYYDYIRIKYGDDNAGGNTNSNKNKNT